MELITAYFLHENWSFVDSGVDLVMSACLFVRQWSNSKMSCPIFMKFVFAWKVVMHTWFTVNLVKLDHWRGSAYWEKLSKCGKEFSANISRQESFVIGIFIEVYTAVNIAEHHKCVAAIPKSHYFGKSVKIGIFCVYLWNYDR